MSEKPIPTLKPNEPATGYSYADYFAWYKFKGGHLNKKTFYKIMDSYGKNLAIALGKGETMRLPGNMGELYAERAAYDGRYMFAHTVAWSKEFYLIVRWKVRRAFKNSMYYRIVISSKGNHHKGRTATNLMYKAHFNEISK